MLITLIAAITILQSWLVKLLILCKVNDLKNQSWDIMEQKHARDRYKLYLTKCEAVSWNLYENYIVGILSYFYITCNLALWPHARAGSLLAWPQCQALAALFLPLTCPCGLLWILLQEPKTWGELWNSQTLKGFSWKYPRSMRGEFQEWASNTHHWDRPPKHRV